MPGPPAANGGATPIEDQARLYSVTELGSDLGVSARTIRFYEDKALITPQRAGGARVYTARDRARMILILRGKRLGFSLREIKEYLDLYDQDATQREQVQALLRSVRTRIGSLEQQGAAVAQTLAELRDIEQQAAEALERMPGPRTTAASETASNLGESA